MSDRLSHHNGAFFIARSSIEILRVDYRGVLFEQDNNSAAAVEEHAFFLAAVKAMFTVEIFNFANQHCANLNLSNRAEILGLHHGVFTAVLAKNGVIFKRDGSNCVQPAAQEGVAALCAVIKVAVAVIMVNA